MLFAFVTAMSVGEGVERRAAADADGLRGAREIVAQRGAGGAGSQQGDEERDGTQSMAHETPLRAPPGATGLALEDRESPLQILHVAF